MIIDGRTSAVIKSRHQAGESVESLIADYDLSAAQVAAILGSPDPLEAALNRRGIVGESISANLLGDDYATAIH